MKQVKNKELTVCSDEREDKEFNHWRIGFIKY